MQSLIAIITIVLYMACLVSLVRHVKKQQPKVLPGAFFALMAVTLTSHSAFLHVSIFRDQMLHLNFFSVSPLIFFVITVISLATLLKKQPIENLMLLLFPLVILGIAFAAWIPAPATKVITSPKLSVHIVLSIIAYSVITIAALHAVLLAAQEHALKRHDFTGLFRFFPPLQTMEKLLFQMLATGFAMLTLAIASGFIFLDDMFAQDLAHKTVLSIIAWFIFAILLYGRHAWGWRGNTATRWTLTGFFILMLAYFGSKFVLEILLQRV